MRTNHQSSFFDRAFVPGTSQYRGIAVIPASGAYGSWTAITTVSYPVSFVYVTFGASATTATARPYNVDIGIDPAGGTSYTVVLSKLLGGMVATNWTQQVYMFPLSIPSGSSIAARAWSINTTAIPINVHTFGTLSKPEMHWSGTYSETLGYTSGALGTTVVAGNGVKGSWTSLGTTTQNLKYWQVGFNANNGTLNLRYLWCDLAYGNGTDFTPIISNRSFVTQTDETVYAATLDPALCYRDVPAGSTIYARLSSNTTPDSGYNIMAYGIGGN